MFSTLAIHHMQKLFFGKKKKLQPRQTSHRLLKYLYSCMCVDLNSGDLVGLLSEYMPHQCLGYMQLYWQMCLDTFCLVSQITRVWIGTLKNKIPSWSMDLLTIFTGKKNKTIFPILMRGGIGAPSRVPYGQCSYHVMPCALPMVPFLLDALANSLFAVSRLFGNCSRCYKFVKLNNDMVSKM